MYDYINYLNYLNTSFLQKFCNLIFIVGRLIYMAFSYLLRYNNSRSSSYLRSSSFCDQLFKSLSHLIVVISCIYGEYDMVFLRFRGEQLCVFHRERKNTSARPLLVSVMSPRY